MFDLDETLVTGDLIKRASEDLLIDDKVDKVYTGADIDDFEMSNLPKVIRDKVIQYFSDPIKGCLDKEPVAGVYYFLYYLMLNNHQLGIVTSRPKSLEEPTYYILHRDFRSINFTLGVHFVNMNEVFRQETKISKKAVISQLKPDFYFDDHIKFCEDAKEYWVPNIYLVSNKHTGWNHKDTQFKKIRNVAFLDKKELS